jgi:virginiamycin A acetyltransferase
LAYSSENKKLEVGDYTYGYENITCKYVTQFSTVCCRIGKFCSIGDDVTIFYGNGFHNLQNVSIYPFGNINTDTFGTQVFCTGTTNGDIIIGNDVWIGNNVTIMSGVHIGSGAILAANSHIIKDVEPYSIVGGNPAVLIKKRFNQEDIDALLKLEWWNWTIEKLNSNKHLLNSTNIKELCQIT